ncbi:GNAT family N-acetyltransferase [Nostoc sp.]|uniref:GNAT family N-acetyltransferase n=1 Tax=Nostoc sp. TaxID=1180 RepID=UPI002FF8D978
MKCYRLIASRDLLLRQQKHWSIFAFTRRELKRIIAHSPDNHAASIRILKKLGMQQIGRDENLPKWELKLESRQFLQINSQLITHNF